MGYVRGNAIFQAGLQLSPLKGSDPFLWRNTIFQAGLQLHFGEGGRHGWKKEAPNRD